MKVAIIGAGISGLVAGLRLQSEHDVTLFESSACAGGHTHTVDVASGGGKYAIDTGFIVFNDRTYPNFIRLLDELGVASRPTTMSFSVRDEKSGLEYNGHSLNTLFAQRRNLFRPDFCRMLLEILRFNRSAPELLAGNDETLTVADFLKQGKYSRMFAQNYLLPMGAAIWSCPVGVFAGFPVRFVAEFFRNHGLLNIRNRPTWRVVEGGSRTYVRAILRKLGNRIRLSTPVEQVRRSSGGVAIAVASGAAGVFDHVVFACHSDQALRILGEDATPVERELLGAFPYSRNVAILHTDQSLLPGSRRAWASWNFLLDGNDSAPASVTYNMNLLQGLKAPQTFCVTLNDESRIDPGQVLYRTVYHHPVFTTGRARAQSRHGELLNQNRSSFCGAYGGNGFHEDGVNSAMAVVQALRMATPSEPSQPAGSGSLNR